MPLSAELLDAARRFCQELRWTGPAMLEFKHDPAAGTYVLMEVNGRLWGSLALAVHAGVDFPRLLYEMLVQRRVTPTFSYRVPCFVRHSTADCDWLLTNLRSQQGRQALRQVRWRHELAGIISGRDGYDLEAADDPIPAAVAWLELLRDKAAKVWGKLEDRWAQTAAARQGADRAALLRAAASAQSILFVCTGNINRSAFAEKKLAGLVGGPAGRHIASAGLLPEANRPTGQVSRAVAAGLGVDLAAHRSTVLTPGMLDAFDLIFYMEPAHLRGIRALSHRAAAKCYPLSALEENPSLLEIPDPDGQGRSMFQNTYGRIAGCVAELAGLLGRRAA